MPTKVPDSHSPTAVPLEFSGKWVAWDAEHSHIVAQAETLPQLWQVVRNEHISDPVFEKIPHANVRFVGMQ